jgi:glycosyltransferase 2 family protein
MISSIFPARQQVLPGSGTEPPIGRRAWASMAMIAILAAVAAWLLYHALRTRGFDWRLALSSLAHVRLGWLLLAVAGIYASYWGRTLRWVVFLRPLKAQPSLGNLFAATVMGFTAITLLGRPGELVRPYLIATKEGVPLASQLAAWLLERIADLLMVLLLFGFALARVGPKAEAAGPRLRWVLTQGGMFVALAAGSILLVLVFFRHLIGPLHRWSDRMLRFLPERMFIALNRLVETFVRGVECTRNDAALLEVLAYSVLAWLLIVFSYWCLAASFPGLNLTFVDVLVLMGFAALGASVQIPGIGGGIQVTAVVVLTELFGVRLEQATVFAFLIWILTFVAVVPVGLVLSMREGLEWDKLRRLNLSNS